MAKTITIKLDDKTKEFYHNAFLARKLSIWVEMFKALYNFSFDDDVSDLSDEDIVLRLGDKEVAKNFLSATAYEDYLSVYDEIYHKG